MAANKEVREVQPVDSNNDASMSDGKDVKEVSADVVNEPVEEPPKRSIPKRLKDSFFTFGSATQIVSAALLAVAIGLIVSTQADNVPEAAVELVNIPGDLWLRALKAVGKYSYRTCGTHGHYLCPSM
jgi:hypothetical protein